MKQVKPITFLEYQYASDPMFSPDGKTLAFLVSRADLEGNRYKGNIHCSVEGGEPWPLTARGDVGAFAWTPENTLLFSALRCDKLKKRVEQGEELTAYYEICPKGGEARLAFTLPMKASGLRHLDGDLYAFIGEYVLGGPKTPEERLALKKKEEVYDTYDELPFLNNHKAGVVNKVRKAVYTYDRKTGEITQVSDPEKLVTYLTSDGARLLYCATEYVNTVRSQDVAIYLYDSATKTHTCVMEADRLMERNLEVYAQIWGDKVIAFGTKGEQYGRTESPAAYLIDPETKEMTLFAKPEYNINYRSIMTDSKLGGGQCMKVVGDRIYFTTTVNYNTYVQYFDKSGKWSEYLTGDGSLDGFDISGGKLAVCGFYGGKLSEIYLDGKQLSHLNDALMSELSLSVPKHFTFKNSDGVEIDGWVMEPIGYQPGKKYPGILTIHGGPRANFGEIFFHENQIFCNAGYFVFYCNPRGSEGKGDDFADVWGKMGSFDYTDIMEFADEALKRYPDIDEKKLGVMGGSYGGYMTNWIVGHTDRFAAACTQRSISNWISFEHATSIGYYWSPNFNHATTAENQEYLWDISPLKYAHNCKTPLLVIHSDGDNVCWMAEGFQMFTAVKAVGCPAKMCLFKGEDHELSRSGRPQPRLARWEEMLNWMNTYLK